MTAISERLSDTQSAAVAEAVAEIAAVRATVEAQGWKDCEGSDTLQCGCGRIARADQFVSRRLAHGRGPRVTLCRQCAERGPT